MAGPLYRLGQFCVRHKVLVIALWLVLFVALVGAARVVGTNTNDNLTLPGTDSQAATDLLQSKFPEEANGTNPVVFTAPSGHKLDESKYQSSITDVYNAYKNDKGAVQDAVSPFSSDGASQLSKGMTIAYISLTLKDSASDLNRDDAQKVLDVADPAKKAGMKVSIGSYAGQKLSKPSTHLSEVVGIVAAVIILLFTFGTVVAMGMPIITALFGLVSGLSIIALLGQITDVPTSAPALATMIGLGVGIDYGLFVVTRHRQQVQGGMEVSESTARAIATSGGAVVFAGGTVMIALLSLLVAGIPLVTTLGYTSAIVVFIAVLAAITLMPALLGLLGTRINALKLPGLRHQHDDKPHGWRRWARFVANHPWPAIAASVVVLLVLALPVRNLHLGQTNNGALPTDTQTRQSYDAISKGFGPGENGPLLVADDLSKKPAQNDQKQLDDVQQQQSDAQSKQQKQAQDDITKETQQLVAQGVPQAQAQQQATDDVNKQQKQENDKNASSQQQTQQQEDFLKTTASDPRLQDLRTDMEKTPGVKSVTQPLVNDSGTAAVYTVISDYAPSSTKTEDLVNDLRDNTIPKATKGQDMTADVGGSTAGYVDLASQIGDTLPLTIAVVLLLSFLLLMLAFRSILVPLKAVLMNLLSIGAAFGIVTYVFGHHWSATAVGLDTTVPIVSFVPLMMFAILFGLSMDYEVFLMSRVREDYLRSGNPHDAVVDGLAVTGRVITSAALIMVSVFCAFILSGDPNIKQFGLGMAAAVAVDATIIRCLLVPAIMSVLGRGGWWMPGWLDRATPKISIEGEEFFAERDAQAKADADADGNTERITA